MATLAPCSASFRAIPLPMPRELPVINACFPLSDILTSFSQSCLHDAFAQRHLTLGSSGWRFLPIPCMPGWTARQVGPSLDGRRALTLPSLQQRLRELDLVSSGISNTKVSVSPRLSNDPL